MWVDIANLIGPKGADGADGQRGEPGPINIGLNPDEPLRWDQTGGFTFQFIDGSEQTVNLPIASAQSAGLLSAADKARITVQEIPDGSDLDSYLTTGVFHESSSAGAATGRHYPAPYAGLLEAFAFNGFGYQRYTVFGSRNQLYARQYTASGWTEWRRLD